MLPRERVIKVIQHKRPDRIPVYGWLHPDSSDSISRIFGSVEAFEDLYEFDYTHLFASPVLYAEETLQAVRDSRNGTIEPAALFEAQISDPNDTAHYESMKERIEHYKDHKGRFVYVQTPGIFEDHNTIIGMEQHLVYLLTHEDEMRKLYERHVEWTSTFAHNCIDLGVDMIHVSDDWGTQRCPLISPNTWWNTIYPCHRKLAGEVKQHGAFLSLHSDGNINEMIEGIIKIGYDVVHPWQESAGMDFGVFRERYMNYFTVMGGLDVQTVIGFRKFEKLRSEIERIVSMFSEGGLLFCTSHFVQPHCTIEELTFAFDTIYYLVRKYGIS